jgi:tetratricopeptide (TPR) repeat protein
MKVFWLVVVLLASAPLAFAQSSFPAGQVIEKIPVLTSDQSYAAYLPANYTSEKSWPTVFCLDPRARGKFALERFVKAAEKYGYIVLCSNNSRNGLDGPTISQIFTDFWADAHQRFNIDQNRTYAAGFSGGARLASTFASRCRGCLTGVILAGAGFPGDTQPEAKTPFACYGIVGTDDFNFGEFLDLEKKYRELSLPYHIESFAGGHEWAPELNLQRALAWFTLQAMKAGTVVKDEAFIDEQFSARTLLAETELAATDNGTALRSFQSLVRDFQALRDTTVAARKVDQIQKTFDSRKEEKAEDELVRRQLKEVGEILSLWMKAPAPDETVSARYEAKSRIAEWRKKKDVAEDSRERRLARRILSHLLIQSFEAAQPLINQGKNYSVALANYQLAREIDPKNVGIVYEIARMYALKRDKKAAVEALEEAVALGFKDVTRIKSEEAFGILAIEPRFQKLLDSLR